MLNFKELSDDGQDLELLVREILFRQGFSVRWSGKGPDGGRDLTCIERRDGFFCQDERSWLIQCKHNANSEKSVGVSELDDILDSCVQHNCQAYLLVCSTYPSSGVVNRLEGISSNPKHSLIATYWDSVKVERLLSTPQNWPLAQRFFPKSAAAQDWQIYATTMPNQWVVTYKGYYFHLKNRISSNSDYHLSSINKRISDLEAINLNLPKNHFLRPRSVYCDDKNGNYEWYIDYMYPSEERAVSGSAQIANELGDGFVLEDGQGYSFHIKLRSYFHSDHYDPDHYTYYDSDIPANGGPRSRFDVEAIESKDCLLKSAEEKRVLGFTKLCKKLEVLPFIRLIKMCNSHIEYLDRFYLQKNWSEIIESLKIDNDRFFSAWFLISVTDEDAFHDLVSHFPQSVDNYFRLTRAHVYLPTGQDRSIRDDDDDLLYELTLSIHPSIVSSKVTGRKLINEYFEQIASAVDDYTTTH